MNNIKAQLASLKNEMNYYKDYAANKNVNSNLSTIKSSRLTSNVMVCCVPPLLLSNANNYYIF